jgi:large subunit ribosomal protein L6
MSRIGRKPIPVASGATVEINGSTVSVKGAKGELSREFPWMISFAQDNGEVTVERANESKQARAMHGTARALIANMIEGVTNGFVKELHIEGVGFKGVMQGRDIVLSLGYSHEIVYQPPEGVDIVVNNNTAVVITGVDNQKVGQAAAQIRSYYKAEPYKGKGVRYKGEQIRRKVGKAVA